VRRHFLSLSERNIGASIRYPLCLTRFLQKTGWKAV
jgi:hypothetical protein